MRARLVAGEKREQKANQTLGKGAGQDAHPDKLSNGRGQGRTQY